MKGLYLNVPDARTLATRADRLLGAPSSVAAVEHHADVIVVNVHPLDWPDGPIFHDLDHDLTLAGAGWFIFRGRAGNLADFAEAFLRARTDEERRVMLREIAAGAFVILILQGDERWVATDPFGLHPHYHMTDDPLATIAPSPYFLTRGGTDATRRDDVLSRALGLQGHLFGNYTAYHGIERLPPGTLLGPRAPSTGSVAEVAAALAEAGMLRPEGARMSPAGAGGRGRKQAATTPTALRYYDYAPQTGMPPVDEETGAVLLERLRHVLHGFGERPRILPLSGGLDSRLLLGLGDLDYGYTFGPPLTGDRPIARRFAHHFSDYQEFSFLDLDYPREMRQAGYLLLHGVCAQPFVELLPAYRRLFSRWGESGVFLDGYAGDVLQRGTLLTWGGRSGGFAKLFPRLGRRRFDPLRLLDRRYPLLEPPARALLHETFHWEMDPWEIDPFRKALLFELIHGRGARHALNGGTILSGQYFTAVQPFFIPVVFRTLWATDPRDLTSYRALSSLWRGMPRELANVRTYSGFKPVWQHDIARATMLVTKALGKMGVWKRSVGYESELKSIRWEGDEQVEPAPQV